MSDMEKVYSRPTGILQDCASGFCPGCFHGTIHKLICEVLEEMGLLDRAIRVAGIGCSGLGNKYLDMDNVNSPHGRACAVATAVKRCSPDSIVFTYQGDGDLASIGGNELLHVCERGELITTIFINNAIYGMTGGQMAPTTLIGQKATTCTDGRNAEKQGMPMRICELVSTLDRAVYVERCSLDTPANIRKAKQAINRAFEVQKRKLGYSFVELLCACPTNWGMPPAKALEWVRSDMMAYYPVKQFRCPAEVK